MTIEMEKRAAYARTVQFTSQRTRALQSLDMYLQPAGKEGNGASEDENSPCTAQAPCKLGRKNKVKNVKKQSDVSVTAKTVPSCEVRQMSKSKVAINDPSTLATPKEPSESKNEMFCEYPLPKPAKASKAPLQSGIRNISWHAPSERWVVGFPQHKRGKRRRNIALSQPRNLSKKVWAKTRQELRRLRKLKLSELNW